MYYISTPLFLATVLLIWGYQGATSNNGVDIVLCQDKRTECPDKNTCCNQTNQQPQEWHLDCCPFENAVCCNKAKSCCPENYKCNNEAKTCDKDDKVLKMTNLREEQDKKGFGGF